MKKILLYLLLLSSGIAGAQAIVVPDANFEAKLFEADAANNIAKDSDGNAIAIDADANGVITVAEAQGVWELNVSGSAIASLDGVENFSNLRVLNCSLNFPLAALNVSVLTYLRELNCNGCSLTAINFGSITDLREINCSSNQLTGLNVSGFQNLITLNCGFNAITAIDVTGLTLLETLLCGQNALTTLDCSSNINLATFSCFNNQLQTLFLKNGMVEDILETIWMGNDGLEYICADQEQIGQLGAVPNTIQVNSYCSYEPGGIYNRIEGTVRFDADNNGSCGDAGDYNIPSLRVMVSEGGYEDTVFTKADGSYVFYVGEGEYEVVPVFENEYFSNSPIADAAFIDVTGEVAVRDFCVYSNGVPHTDIEVVMAPLTVARPGFDTEYTMVYKNKGNQVIPAGNVICNWDSSRLSYVIASENIDVIGVDTYTWNYTALKPFETREITMTLNVNSPTDTPPVNINDVLGFTVSVDPGTDDIPEDNTFDFNQVVVGSFDPNNIVCLEGENVSPDNIGEYLHYIVNFENTGTFPANFVVVEMEINPDEFDLSTFSLIDNSHDTNVRTTGNKVEIRFDNIMLATDGNGNLLYKIKSRNGLMAGDAVTGRANIYFDYNFPILTDPAITTFDVLGLGDFEKDNLVVVYPNPSKGIVKIDAVDTAIKSIQLYDIQGRLLQIGLVNDASVSVDISGRAPGVYVLKIVTEKGIQAVKLIRE